MRIKKYIFIFISLAVLLSASGFSAKDVVNPKAADANNFVCNPDGILSHSAVEKINVILQQLEADTRAEVAVVALNSIGDEEISDFGVQLFKEWGIGKKELDNGLLILFVLDQRALRFEVGYGLEGVLPDGICKRIQTQAMIPEFKKENYDVGILAGVEHAAAYIRKEPLPEENKVSSRFSSEFVKTIFIILLIYLFLAWILLFIEKNKVKRVKNSQLLLNNQQRYELYSSADSVILNNGCVLPFIGLTLCFLGYLYAGFAVIFSPLTFIPAVLSRKKWKDNFRNAPVHCSNCENRMRRLSEKEDNQHLIASQDKEDELNSIDADVFLCDKCGQKEIFRYDNKLSKYKHCPHCLTKAYYLTGTHTITSPTYSRAGLEEDRYLCLFCDYTHTKNKNIPRLTHSSSVAAGSFGGKAISRSGSFGGGRSGGGGATSRW